MCRLLCTITALILASTTLASEDTIGPGGINSQATGLTGLGAYWASGARSAG